MTQMLTASEAREIARATREIKDRAERLDTVASAIRARALAGEHQAEFEWDLLDGLVDLLHRQYGYAIGGRGSLARSYWVVNWEAKA